MKYLIIIGLLTTIIHAGGKKKVSVPNIDIKVSDLKSHVEFLINTPKPRSWENTDVLNSISEYISNKFGEIGLKPEYQKFEAYGNHYRNVIGVLNENNNNIIVIGAHYDVYGDLPGADDNATGVSGLIELAKILKEYESNIPYQIQFVAYANEEPPFFGSELMGSYIHAKSLHDSSLNVEFMISLEMLGFFTDEKKSQEYPSSLLKLFYPTTGNFIAVVSKYGNGKYRKGLRNSINKYSGIKCRSLAAPSFLTGIDFSDHRNYWAFGYKAIMITDTSFYRNKNYHTDGDTIDTLDFDKMKEVVKGIALHFIMLG